MPSRSATSCRRGSPSCSRRAISAHTPAAGGRVAQMVQLLVEQALVHRGQCWMPGRNRRRHVRAAQQQPAGRRAKNGSAAESRAVRRVVGRRREDELDRQRPQLAPREPAAEHQHGQHPVLDALARHRPAAAHVAEHQPVAARIGLEREGGGVRNHRQVARQAFEAGLEVRAADHRVAQRVEIAMARRQFARQAESRLARAADGQLPEQADLVGRKACLGRIEPSRGEAGVAQQGCHVEALGRKHVEHAAQPGARAGAGQWRRAADRDIWCSGF